MRLGLGCGARFCSVATTPVRCLPAPELPARFAVSFAVLKMGGMFITRPAGSNRWTFLSQKFARFEPGNSDWAQVGSTLARSQAEGSLGQSFALRFVLFKKNSDDVSVILS